MRLTRLRQKGLLLDIGDTIAYLDPEVLDKIKILESLKDKPREELKSELAIYKYLFNKISKISKVQEIMKEVLI